MWWLIGWLVLGLLTAAGQATALEPDGRLILGQPLGIEPGFGRLPAPEAAWPVPEATGEVLAMTYRDANLTASSLRLDNDFESERGVRIISGVTNSGSEPLTHVICQLYLGDPEAGGTPLGEAFVFPELAPGTTEYHASAWSGWTGEDVLYLVVDPDDLIAEADEEDNTDTLAVCLCGNVPWEWQVVNGYCNYASLTMLFNHRSIDNTLYETVELACCAHSMLYIDGEHYLGGGILVSQSLEDYEFAGEIRNLASDIEVRSGWYDYLDDLRNRIARDEPFVTSVDPYYLPQPDYDPLRLYGLHGGHAVVVTGYTDSSVVINDPGVGLEIIDPPLPHPELRGADVVVDLATFRLAVQHTLGSSYVLISYVSVGPVPSHGAMLSAALLRSQQRLDGEPGVYGGWTSWPPGWIPTYGDAAFGVAAGDMNLTDFVAFFEALMDATGHDLVAALNELASRFYNGIWMSRLGWEAAAAFYTDHHLPAAPQMVVAMEDLALLGQQVEDTYLAMLEAIYASGGDPLVAGPYLPELATALDAILSREDDVRGLLLSLHASEVALDPSGEAAWIPSALVGWPNPFRGETHLVLHDGTVPSGAVRIHDISGRVVRVLPGGGSLRWDGADTAGRPVRDGVYFARDTRGQAARLIKLR